MIGRCSWCGSVELPPGGLVFHIGSRREALFEFGCPRCGRHTLGPLDPSDVEALVEAGIRPRYGPAPFELLEQRSGPPINLDDLIEFHQAMNSNRLIGNEVSDLRRLVDPTEERDAA